MYDLLCLFRKEGDYISTEFVKHIVQLRGHISNS